MITTRSLTKTLIRVALIATCNLSTQIVQAQDVPDWAVPDATGEPLSLPSRPMLDLDTAPDFRAAINRTFDVLDHFDQTDPALSSRVMDLAIDPRAAFVLMRDTVQSIPYAGRLRSPEAVFAAGSANAYDKAAALAALLGSMGYDTRLIQSEAPLAVEEVSGCGGNGPIDPQIWRLTGLGPDILSRIRVRAEASYRALHPLLSPGPTSSASDHTPHIWVQMRDGTDWVDLDPWLPDTEWGEYPAGQGRTLEDLPQAQSVWVALTAETLRDGRLRANDILNVRLDMPDAADALVSLSFGPQVDGVGGSVADALRQLQGQTGSMLGYLSVNGQNYKSGVFSAPGVSSQDSGFLAADVTEVVTALWLTVTSKVPGQPDHSERRPIIDLIPDALRQAASGGELVDPTALLPTAKGDRFPAALESLRHIVISNGGASRRTMAARSFLQMQRLPQLLRRTNAGGAEPWDLIWTSWLEAKRISVAADELIRARPAHEGACTIIDRPRVMIWGISAVGDGRSLRWLDWTLDDIGMIGGQAADRTEARLWHGTVQAALEKEALMMLTAAAPDFAELDAGPMQPLSEDAVTDLGQGARQDQADAYLAVASRTTTPDAWWRLDPLTGRADARGKPLGNIWYNYVNASPNIGIVEISAAEEASIMAELEARGSQGFADAIGREMEIREAERARPKGGGTEYVIVLNNVSIPASVAVGTTVGIAVISGLLYALFG